MNNSDENELTESAPELRKSLHADEGRHDAGGAMPALSPSQRIRSIARFFTFRRLLTLFLIAAAIGVFFALGLDAYVTFDSLKENREWLARQVDEHHILAVLSFITIYAVVTGLSLPGATVVSISGGFLFGLWFGTVWNVIGATTGASLLFVAARTILGDVLYRRVDPWLEKVDSEFRSNSFSYLLFLRLVPLFPFFVVNLVPAFVGVSFRTFFITTLVGIIPGAFVYTSVGAGLGSVFDSGEEFTILTPEIVVGLIGLGVLSLLPVAIKLWRRRRARP